MAVTQVEANDLGFTEGPIVLQGGGVLVTSIDRGHLYRIVDGQAAVWATTGGGPNGAVEGMGGKVYVAQNGGWWPARRWPFVTGGVQVAEPGGRVSWLTQDLVSPNDLCFGPDGYLYVTDPTRNGRRDDGRLWRCDPASGEAELLCSVPWYPNGIGFGLEDHALYVASSGEAAIRRFTITSGRLSASEIAVKMTTGHPDGFAFDTEGQLVIAAPGEGEDAGTVQTWTRDGKFLDLFEPGSSHHYTNLALDSEGELMISDSTGGGVLRVSGWPARGLALHPFREGPVRPAQEVSA